MAYYTNVVYIDFNFIIVGIEKMKGVRNTMEKEKVLKKRIAKGKRLAYKTANVSKHSLLAY